MGEKWRNDSKPTVALLRECLDYDPETGVLVWRHRPLHHFVDARSAASWNTRFANRPVRKRMRGYVVVVITVGDKPTYSSGHRVAWAMTTGEWPEFEIDHKNLNRSDNRFENLRPATHQQNQWNKGVQSNNKSGFKGVHQHTQNGTWVAQIAINKRTCYLGSFASPEEAAQVYDAAHKRAHGEYARTST